MTLSHPVAAMVLPDPARVIAQLFVPGEELSHGTSRRGAVVARVLALPEDEVERLVDELLRDFRGRHRGYHDLLLAHAALVSPHVLGEARMSVSRTLLMGATFTNEYALEGAALCNPSAVPHPDQSGLKDGQLRLAISLRAIGEGHLSSIGFCTAVAGPGPEWSFEPRPLPVVPGTSSPARWHREHLRAVLADRGQIDGLAHSVLVSLPELFTEADLELALAGAHHDRLGHIGGRPTTELLRHLVTSAYQVTFPDDIDLGQQVLCPVSEEESHGLEDARFVRFTGDDGSVGYRATYTAYDGRQIAPRLLISPDLRTFHAHRLAGPAARNKGMALFPRQVGGEHLALCRSDGESTSLTRSADGFVWQEPTALHTPTLPWEVLQVGNCGSPIETDRGWLVLTHGVGPMRVYTIGALLLDLDDPRRVLAHLEEPFLRAAPAEREGYVPNVVYSCGGVVHDGRLWLPYGIGDARIGVAWADVEELLDAMTTH
ncbi:glycoside hydrolase family 130 protein [Kineosporia sp. NBRC 101731]|uniref:glycoside hydrolase family 130 protein n=1 Tax=Kineosporia sp. NBRC 101731 TaxID=3032199 RepID=UPI0024A4ECC8|nr:glycoside hydrolase family 130 protein [Kineosporia sp. NBRC 101731]GLY29049.1 glycosidase [Kineosporia sp. NBRC 101731]